MSQIISVSVDLSKLDKSKIIAGKNGAKYYNLQVFTFDKKDQYNNDAAVCEPQTKEQREAKEKKVYLGNGRVVWGGTSQQSASTPAPRADGKIYENASQKNNNFEDLPF